MFPPATLPSPVAIAKVAKTLGISRRGAEQLALCGLADTLVDGGRPTAFTTAENKLVVSDAALNALAEVPWVDADHGPAVNVRVRAAIRVNDMDRGVMGWHSQLTPSDADLAITRWWGVPRRETVGSAFVATVAGFVVCSGRITDTTIDRGQVAYSVDWNDPDVRTTWAGHRIATPPGGNTVYLGSD